MAMPLVSVIIPCYNHAHYVEAAIRSVIAQDYENIELVILDDGSKDDSVAVINALEKECQNRFVRYEFFAKENEGVAVTMNRGVEWARGEFISSVSSDDEMRPHKISTLLTLAQKTHSDIACGDSSFMNNDGQTIALSDTGDVTVGEGKWENFVAFYLRNRKDVIPEKNFFAYETLVDGNYVPGMAMMWSKRSLKAVGGFTPGMAIEDWDLWLKLARNYSCAFTPEVVSRYRLHGANASVVNLVKMRLGIDKILEREFEYARNQRKVLAPKIARMWLRNARKLYKAGYKEYLHRFFQYDIVLAALGVVLSSK